MNSRAHDAISRFYSNKHAQNTKNIVEINETRDIESTNVDKKLDSAMNNPVSTLRDEIKKEVPMIAAVEVPKTVHVVQKVKAVPVAAKILDQVLVEQKEVKPIDEKIQEQAPIVTKKDSIVAVVPKMVVLEKEPEKIVDTVAEKVEDEDSEIDEYDAEDFDSLFNVNSGHLFTAFFGR